MIFHVIHRLAVRVFRVRGTIGDQVLLSLLIGLVVGGVSVGFYLTLLVVEHWIFSLMGMETGHPPSQWFLAPFIVGLGGLLSGVIVYSLAPEAEGHGTDAVVAAFHRRAGHIGGLAPLAKFLASIATIGFGGSAGREGPMAQIGGGIASVLSRLFNSPIRLQRTAVLIGMASGIGAMFKAPLGASVFAIEVIYRRDFEAEALIPAFIAALTGYAVMGYATGFEHVFIMEFKPLTNVVELLFYAVLGLFTALVGVLYVKTFYGVHGLFKTLSLPRPVKPLIGGVLTGILAIFAPQVLGGGYEWMGVFVDGDIFISLFGRVYYFNLYSDILPGLAILVLLIPLKILATSFSVGSGGSGGVFAPGLFLGGVVGLITSILILTLFPGYVSDPRGFTASMVIVGMVSLFGGVSKAPLAVLIMVSEMTGSYELMAPAMLSIAISYFLTGRHSIYSEQVEDRERSPAHWRSLK